MIFLASDKCSLPLVLSSPRTFSIVGVVPFCKAFRILYELGLTPHPRRTRDA